MMPLRSMKTGRVLYTYFQKAIDTEVVKLYCLPLGALRHLGNRHSRCVDARAGTSSYCRASRRLVERHNTRSSKGVLSRERARARLRALAGPQALQHHAALPDFFETAT